MRYIRGVLSILPDECIEHAEYMVSKKPILAYVRFVR